MKEKITPQAFYSLLGRPEGGLHLLDVREPDEFKSSHIPGAVNTPLSSLLVWKDQIHPADYVYLYSRAEKRAMTAFRQIFPAICSQVWVLEGGLEAWKELSLPLVCAEEAKGVEVSAQKG